MQLDDNLKQLMKELGAAINDALSDSEDISEAIQNVRNAGYDVFLVLEATIGFNKRSKNDQGDEVTAGGLKSGEMKIHLALLYQKACVRHDEFAGQRNIGRFNGHQ